MHCATFNAFGYRYQREVMRARIVLCHDGRALRELVSRALETTGVSLRELKPRRGSDPIGAFVKALAEVRAALQPPDAVEVTLECLSDTPLVTVPFGPVHAQYLRAQTATGLQSFDDQIYFAVADMLADPAHRAFIQRRFDHVLVDEFQDLNGAQLALVDLLSRPRRQLFVVGDDDQLIYGWRRADPRGILEFHDRMPPKPHSATYTLCTNYRCSRAVVETGARLVAHNTVREAKDIRPRAGAQDGAVRFFGAPSWPERAAALRGFLRAEKSRLHCDWRDLAVLCRYRAQQLLVALALDAGEIPRTPSLGCTLFTHPAAGLLRTYLDLLRAPEEVPAPALAGLLNRPNRFVPRAVAEAVAGATRPWAHVREAAAGEPPTGPRPLSGLVELVTSVRSQLDSAAVGSEDLVWLVVEAFGLDELWAAEADAAAAGAPSDGAGPLEVFDALLLLAETYPDADGYLRTWDRLLADEEAHEGVADDTLAREESGEDRVVIGTIHAAKGREYDSVVIPDYDCDVSRWSPAEVEEERRVVYVGVTRARDAVLFTVDTSTGFVHPFLRELVEAPEPGEHETLTAWLEEATEAAGAAPGHEPAASSPTASPRSRSSSPSSSRRRGRDGLRREKSPRPQPVPPRSRAPLPALLVDDDVGHERRRGLGRLDVRQAQPVEIGEHALGHRHALLGEVGGGRAPVPLRAQFGALQIVVADHVEHVALTPAEPHRHRSLAVLLLEFPAGDEHLHALRIDDRDGVRRRLQPPLRVVLAVQHALQVDVVVVLDLDAHHVIRRRPPAEREHTGERRLDDVLERPVGREQAATGLDEPADARYRGSRDVARAIDDEQLLRAQVQAAHVLLLHQHVRHLESAEHRLDVVVAPRDDDHVARLDLVERASALRRLAEHLLPGDPGRRPVGLVACFHVALLTPGRDRPSHEPQVRVVHHDVVALQVDPVQEPIGDPTPLEERAEGVLHGPRALGLGVGARLHGPPSPPASCSKPISSPHPGDSRNRCRKTPGKGQDAGST